MSETALQLRANDSQLAEIQAPEKGGASPTTARRVLVIAGIVVIAANLRAALTSVGPVLGQIQSDAGLSAGEAGFLAGALPLLVFAATSLLVPRMARRTGTELALWLGLVILTVGILLRSVPTPAMLWIGTILLAVGITVGNVLLPGVIRRDFPSRVGQMTGVYSATIGIVSAIASGVAVPLADMLPGGWRTAVGIWAGVALIAVAVWAPQLSRRAPQTLAPSRTGTAAASPWRSLLAWEVAAFMALAAGGFYVVIFWYPTILHHFGISEVMAGWLLSIYQLVGVVMSLAVPIVLRNFSDQRSVAAVASLILVVSYLGLLLAPGLAILWVVIMGIGGGASFVLALAFFGLRAADERSAASLSGMSQSVAFLFAAVGPVLIGALYEATGEWDAPLWVLIALAAAQAIVGLRAGRDAEFQA